MEGVASAELSDVFHSAAAGTFVSYALSDWRFTRHILMAATVHPVSLEIYFYTEFGEAVLPWFP